MGRVVDENGYPVEYDEQEEERYVLTPKAIFYCALQEAGYIDSMFPETQQMKLAWYCFENDMLKNGYIKDE